jgi:hypothetical protein
MGCKKQLLLGIIIMTLIMMAFLMNNQNVKADNSETEEITVTVERFSIGQGFFIEPTQLLYDDSENTLEIIDDILGGSDNYETYSDENGSYQLAQVYNCDTGSIELPFSIEGELSDDLKIGNNERLDNGAYLGENAYLQGAGWLVYVNNQMISDLSDYYPESGDVIRVRFLLIPEESSDTNKDALTKKISEIKNSELFEEIDFQNSYYESISILANYDVTQSEVDQVLFELETETDIKNGEKTEENDEVLEKNILDSAQIKQEKDVEVPLNDLGITMTTELPKGLKELKWSVDSIVEACAQRRLTEFSKSEPQIGTSNGEWTIICLARSGLGNQELYDTYYKNVRDQVISLNGNLHSVKYTEYSRVILGLTAIGKDVTNVGGYDLLSDMTDFTNIKKQGINGPIWALIALDSHHYPIYEDPNANDQNSREKMVNYILEKETCDENGILGGWSLTNVSDPDIASMALNALNNYMDMPGVSDAVNRGFAYLERVQIKDGGADDGGYKSWGLTNLESLAQVTMMLCDYGIDPGIDSRFITPNGSWVISALEEYYLEASSYGAGFMHVKPYGGAVGSWNDMASDQGMEAFIAYQRVLNGQTTLFDMNDIEIKKVSLESISLNDSKGIFDNEIESQIQLQVYLYPQDTTDEIEINWGSSNTDVAGVDDQGLVTVLSGDVGAAEITVSVKTRGVEYKKEYQVQRGITTEMVQELICELPKPLCEENMETLVYASKGYELLSEAEQKEVEIKGLEEAQEEAKSINHGAQYEFTENGETIVRNFKIINDLPWNMKLNVGSVGIEEKNKIEKEMAAFPKKQLVQLVDIKIKNLMTENLLLKNKVISIAMDVPKLDESKIKIKEVWHYGFDEGQIKLPDKIAIEKTESNQKVIFKTKDFSPFGYVIENKFEGGNIDNPEKDNNKEILTKRLSPNLGGTSNLIVSKKGAKPKSITKKLPIVDAIDIGMVEISKRGQLETQVKGSSVSLIKRIFEKATTYGIPFILGAGIMGLVWLIVVVIKRKRIKG